MPEPKKKSWFESTFGSLFGPSTETAYVKKQMPDASDEGGDVDRQGNVIPRKQRKSS